MTEQPKESGDPRDQRGFTATRPGGPGAVTPPETVRAARSGDWQRSAGVGPTVAPVPAGASPVRAGSAGAQLRAGETRDFVPRGQEPGGAPDEQTPGDPDAPADGAPAGHTRTATGAPAGSPSPGAQPLTGWLNRLTRRIRAFDARRPLVWDLLLTTFWVLAALIDVLSTGWRTTAHRPDTPVWLVTVMTFGLALPLLVRRRHPLAALLVTLPFALVNNWSGAVLQAALLQLVPVFHIALRLPLRTLAVALAVVAVPRAVETVLYPVGDGDPQFLPTLYSFAIVALLGIAVRSRQEYTASLVERARRLEVERDQQARLAAAAERTRIAREMHDIIGHNLSVITGLADGGRYAAAKSPERAAQALDAISTTSRAALAELRRLLGVLREESPARPDRAPQPTLTDLDRLVEGVRAAGLPVLMTTSGRPAPLPPGQELTVYRVVQEALTNTLKHAGQGSRAAVDLAHTHDALTATITDTGPGSSTRTGTVVAGNSSARPGPGAGAAGDHTPPAEGRGVTGMRERAALYDGTLESGPLPGGGWRVRLRLPHLPHLPTTEDTPQ
ncbi:histidine kinase [Streptomyces sp. NPDC004609]|uniref:sensor histidine kinase n=1 Tax=Streptomyces sp. NPDC004609 TaxID=3364704 RepID=UPI0036A56D1E